MHVSKQKMKTETCPLKSTLRFIFNDIHNEWIDMIKPHVVLTGRVWASVWILTVQSLPFLHMSYKGMLDEGCL